MFWHGDTGGSWNFLPVQIATGDGDLDHGQFRGIPYPANPLSLQWSISSRWSQRAPARRQYLEQTSLVQCIPLPPGMGV